MRRRLSEPFDDVTVYLVLNDHGRFGIAFDETDPAKADRETIIRNFLTGQYGNALAGTTNGAAQRGYKAVVPVDGMSSESAFNEPYAAWHIAKGGPANLVGNATLTRSDLIKFGN
jgi:hypothetical protein